MMNVVKQDFSLHKRRPSLAIVPILLALALLGAQQINVQHDHEGDLTTHLDCSICIKLGNEADLLPATTGLPEVERSSSHSTAAVPVTAYGFRVAANARAPPLSHS